MKTIVVITMITFTAISTNAQYDREKEFNTHYGLNISNIYSGSGHGYGVSINTNVQKGRKSLEIGAIYNPAESRFSGADFRYKVFSGPFNDVIYRRKLLKPYFQYNLIYQHKTIYTPVVLTGLKSTVELSDNEPGVVGTMEHYISLGIQLKLHKCFFMDTSLGVGAYIGSLDKEKGPDTFGIHKENHGYTGSFKIGIGYRFN